MTHKGNPIPQDKLVHKKKFITEIKDESILSNIADLKPILEPTISKLLEKVGIWTQGEKEKALALAMERTDREIERLSYLSQINPLVSDKEIEAMKMMQREILTALGHTQCRIDAIRIILTS